MWNEVNPVKRKVNTTTIYLITLYVSTSISAFLILLLLYANTYLQMFVYLPF